MSLRCAYSSENFEVGGIVELAESEARHLVRVLRVNAGTVIKLVNGKGQQAMAEVVEAGEQRRQCRCTCRLMSSCNLTRPEPRVHLLVSPPRQKQMAEIVEAATALGAFSITPVFCRNSVAFPARAEQWQAVAVGALKQSGNPYLPEICDGVEFGERIKASCGRGFFGDIFPAGIESAALVRPHGQIEVWIGPEGGFTDGEKYALKNAGLVPICVGKWILRVEVAVVAVLSVLLGGCTSSNVSRNNEATDV